jgi:hypothetical protein
MALGIGIFVFLDLCVAWVVISSFVAPIRDLAREFPAQAAAADAVRREFQSFSFGMLNAGWGIHVAVDDRFLHLSPSLISRCFRMPRLSIPWSRVRLVRRGRKVTKVRIEGEKDKMEVKGPTWCLDLAS